METVTWLASQSAVVIFSKSSCCMSHAMKRFFCELGVHTVVYEIDEDPRGKDMERALIKALGRRPAVPATFIGGQLRGSMREIMDLHLEGALIPLLREFGAIWL